MKYHPIILSAEAAREVRSGMRTQDVSPVQFPRKWNDAITHDDLDECGFWNAYSHESDRHFWQYGDDRLPNVWQCGDRLWVKEPWCPQGDSDGYYIYTNPEETQYKVWYAADGKNVVKFDDDGFVAYRKDGTECSPWHSPMSMPRWA